MKWFLVVIALLGLPFLAAPTARGAPTPTPTATPVLLRCPGLGIADHLPAVWYAGPFNEVTGACVSYRNPDGSVALTSPLGNGFALGGCIAIEGVGTHTLFVYYTGPFNPSSCPRVEQVAVFTRLVTPTPNPLPTATATPLPAVATATPEDSRPHIASRGRSSLSAAPRTAVPQTQAVASFVGVTPPKTGDGGIR